MARIAWTAPALDQLREIVAFTARHSVARADELNTRLLAAAERLEHLPLLGRVVPEFKLDYLRELIEKPYRILYVVREDICAIVAVIHSRRDLTAHFRPGDLEDDGPI